MKIKISKDALNKHLTFLQTGIPSKPVIPVDGWIFFNITKEGDCAIKISNSAVQMSTLLKVESEIDCQFCVPSMIMTRTVANFPDGDIHIEPKLNEAMGVISIELKPEGQRKKYKVACLPSKEFAHWPVPADDVADVEFKIDMASLHEKFKISGVNVDSRDIRPNFANIIFFSHEGKLMIISGNQFIIACLSTEIPFTKSKIVPYGLSAYTSTLTSNGECTFSITKDRIHLKFGHQVLTTRVVEGSIPTYDKLFENEPAKNILIDRIELVSAVKRLSVFSGDDNKIIISCKGESMQISSTDKNNEAEEYIDIVNPNNLEFTKILSYPFLQNAIENTKSEKISMADKQDNSPLFIRPVNDNNDQLWLVAPHSR